MSVRSEPPLPAESLPDEELVARSKNARPGDMRAFTTLIGRHQDGVQANCRYLSGSAADAEDLAQEVFVRVFFGLKRFEGRSSFRTWLRTVKANHCINYLKKRKGAAFLDLDAPAARASDGLRVQPVGEKDLTREAQRKRIQSILGAMPDSLRIPLVLRDMDGFSYDEIAHELGIGLSATKMRIKRGREMFRSLHAGEEAGAQP